VPVAFDVLEAALARDAAPETAETAG